MYWAVRGTIEHNTFVLLGLMKRHKQRQNVLLTKLNNHKHFCQQTKQMFEENGINLNADVNVSTRLPDGARGFPHFESGVTGKSHTGFPRSVERLYDLLS